MWFKRDCAVEVTKLTDLFMTCKNSSHNDQLIMWIVLPYTLTF